MCCVYIHTVKANGKKYIGQCTNDPKNRWGSKGHRYKGQFFYRAIEKYGWDNIEHEVIAENLTQEEANELEKSLISKYNTTDKQYGYNLVKGGKDGTGSPGGSNHNARAVICIETGQTWECSTYCAKDIGVNLASLQESLYNRYKCKNKHFKYVDDDNYKMNREPYKVLCVETGEIWENVKECAKHFNVHSRSVARWCTGCRNASNGLTYKYVV